MGHSDDALAAVHQIRAAAALADGADPFDEATHLHLTHQGVGPADFLAVAGEAGFALRLGDDVHVVTHPDHRDRGMGTELATELVAEAGPRDLTGWVHGTLPAARALAASMGFRAVRELWVMRRAMADELPPLPSVDGVRLTTYDDGWREQLLAVNAAAFTTHPEQGGMDAANLAQRMAETWFDPRGLLLAIDGDNHLLGFHWTKQHSAEIGEVYVVGIDPRQQGRGLGKLLTLAGLHHLAGVGAREVLLYVEADSAAAVGLYQGLGFSHAAADTHTQFLRVAR